MHKNQKGFLIALCLCLLSVSGIYGVYQYQKVQPEETERVVPEQTAKAEEPELPEKEAANSTGTVAKAEEAKLETEEDLYDIGEAEFAKTEEPKIEEAEEELAEEPELIEEATSEMVQADILEFADSGVLMWPVDGDVILNYSMDKSIYFSTLNQYKYHPAIVISAEVGSEVHCAAKGKVTQMKVNEETGTTLTMALGDGYELIYGQLKEVAVQEGDMVEAGALLGYVSEPTKYYTLEGSNLYLQLLKDGEPMNPLEYIE